MQSRHLRKDKSGKQDKGNDQISTVRKFGKCRRIRVIGTRLFYKIRSYKYESGSKVLSDMPTQCYEGMTIPNPPVLLSQTILSTQTEQATLQWSQPSSGNFTGYRIYKFNDTKPDEDLTYVTLKEWDVAGTHVEKKIVTDLTTALYDGLTPNRFYYFVITSYLSYQKSGHADPTFHIAANFDSKGFVNHKVRTLPPAPPSFTVTIPENDNSANCTWTKPSYENGDTYTYKLQYKKSTENYDKWEDRVIAVQSDLSETIGSLGAGISYDFRVMTISTYYDPDESTNKECESEPYAIYNRSTGLKKPSGVTASVESCNYVTIKWNAVSVSEDQTVTYFVYRDGSSTALNAAGITATKYEDHDAMLADPANTYSYTVRAVVESIQSDLSDPASVTFKVPTPTGLTGVIGSLKVTLSWTPVTDATSYVLERYNVTDSTSTEIPVTGSSYPDTGLNSSKTYKYRIKAIYNSNESDYSNYTTGYKPNN